MSTIKRLFCVGMGLFYLFTGIREGNSDIFRILIGAFLLFYLIIDFLSEEYRIFAIIKLIIGMVIGLALLVFGIVMYTESRDTEMSALFFIVGVLILVTNVYPLIKSFKDKRKS